MCVSSSGQMAPQDPPGTPLAADAYDGKAEEHNWRGPEVAFGLSYRLGAKQKPPPV